MNSTLNIKDKYHQIWRTNPAKYLLILKNVKRLEIKGLKKDIPGRHRQNRPDEIILKPGYLFF